MRVLSWVFIFVLPFEASLQAWPSFLSLPKFLLKRPQYVVIVEPISSGNQLPLALKARGYIPIAVRTETRFLPRQEAGFHAGDFLASDILRVRELGYEGLLRNLKTRDVALVLAGSEMGVSLAYRLADDLGTQSNSPTDLPLHRDKFYAQSALKKAGLDHIPSGLVANQEEVGGWLDLQGGFESLGRLVIKPRDSHGGDLVQVASNPAQLRAAVETILTTRNASNQSNKDMVIQKFIAGEEYAVNGAVTTIDGKLYLRITDVWRYHKSINEAGYPQYGYEELLSYDEIPAAILRVVPKILEALKFKVGAFHSEIKITPEGKAIMIETAARLYGAGNTRIAGAATDYSQINASLDSYLNKSRFLKKAGQPYRRPRLAFVYNINTPPSEVPLSAHDAKMQVVRDRMKRSWWRSDLFHMVNFYTDGQRLDPTNSLLSTFSEVEFLVRDDHRGRGWQRCQEHLRFLKELEQSNYFWSKVAD